MYWLPWMLHRIPNQMLATIKSQKLAEGRLSTCSVIFATSGTNLALPGISVIYPGISLIYYTCLGRLAIGATCECVVCFWLHKSTSLPKEIQRSQPHPLLLSSLLHLCLPNTFFESFIP